MDDDHLPGWAPQRSSDNLHILYGSFNPLWMAGKLEKLIVDQASDYFTKKYPNQKIHIIVPSAYSMKSLIEHIFNINADILIVCSLTDPVDPQLLTTINNKIVIELGYTTNGIPLDFWAIACSKFFKHYAECELMPSSFSYLFLNYNRKPHPHRTQLVSSMERLGMHKLGCITLADSVYTVNDLSEDYVLYGSNDVAQDLGIPNDIYSLGRLDIWNQSFINLVSETCPPGFSGLFLSEKIFKPIIGMRPFIINGNVQIYNWLRNYGFDCFEDMFPVELLLQRPEDAPSIILDSLINYTNCDLTQMYSKILPRLQHNRNTFFKHANEHTVYPFSL
jgi:hypothetical protein